MPDTPRHKPQQSKAAEHDVFRMRPCGRCLQPNLNMRACAKCKGIKYCSRKCQKEDWPDHKETCAFAAETDLTSITKFMERFYYKSTITSFLHLALFYKLKSLNIQLSNETALKAEIVVGIEPVNIDDFRSLITSPTFAQSGDCPLGMLQVLDVSVCTEPPVPVKSKVDYARFRNILDLLGESAAPIITVAMVHPKHDTRLGPQVFSYTTGTPFMVRVDNLADLKKIIIPSPSGNGSGTEKLLSAASCIEYVNMRIRQDHENACHARRKMQREDMQAIHLTMQGRKPAPWDTFESDWMDKVLREDVYDQIPETKNMRLLHQILAGIAPRVA